MSAREFGEWLQYSEIEPFGELRADQRAWLQVALHSNIHRDPKVSAINLNEVLPQWRPAPSEEMVARQVQLFFDTKIASEGDQGDGLPDR